MNPTTSWILLIAIGVLATYTLLWVSYVLLRFQRRQWLYRLLDPDSYPRQPMVQACLDALRDRIAAASDRPGNVTSRECRYRIIRRLGSGDLCDVWLAKSAGNAFVIKIPHAGCGPTLLAHEQSVLSDLHDSVQSAVYAAYLPNPVDSFWADDRFVSVLRYRSGYHTALEIRDRFRDGLDTRHLAWMFNRTLEVLGMVHRAGWIHGAVLPPHLLYDTSQHGLQLIDWIHATPTNTTLQVVPKRYKAWYPPESHRRCAATSATDVYLAAKSITWLAGGDPLTDQVPDHVPLPFARLLRSCMSVSPAHRPDAWALHERLRNVLEDLYGPPKFSHLAMS